MFLPKIFDENYSVFLIVAAFAVSIICSPHRISYVEERASPFQPVVERTQVDRVEYAVIWDPPEHSSLDFGRLAVTWLGIAVVGAGWLYINRASGGFLDRAREVLCLIGFLAWLSYLVWNTGYGTWAIAACASLAIFVLGPLLVSVLMNCIARVSDKHPVIYPVVRLIMLTTVVFLAALPISAVLWHFGHTVWATVVSLSLPVIFISLAALPFVAAVRQEWRRGGIDGG